MRTIVKRLRYSSRTDTFRLFPFPDAHLGNAACDEASIQREVDEIKRDPMARWFGMGDYCEFINRKDKRFREDSLAPWLWGKADLVKAQRDRAVDILSPIADKCLALVQGNHEVTMLQYSERDVYGTICEKMGASEARPLALGFSGFLRLVFTRRPGETKLGASWNLDLFLTHGWWAGRLYGNGELQLERVYGWAVCDIVVAGHDHKRRAVPITRVAPMRNGQVEYRQGWMCSAGTFLDGALYAEEKGYRPLPTGWLELRVTPDKHEVKVLH